MSGRIVNLVLGFWLVLSAFLWVHSGAQFTNAWVSGLLVAAIALAASRVPDLRYANAVMGGWLMVSTFFLPRVSAGTFWNHLVVGLAVLFLSLFPTRSGVRVSRRSPTMPGGTPSRA